jgi:hypothetical protein
MAGNSEHTRGEMDIAEQVSTYNLVMGMTKWGSLAVAAAVLWLTLWFCTDAGLLGATFTAAVLVVLGVVFLREKPAAAAAH